MFQLYVDTAYNWYIKYVMLDALEYVFQLYVDTAYNWYTWCIITGDVVT